VVLGDVCGPIVSRETIPLRFPLPLSGRGWPGGPGEGHKA